MNMLTNPFVTASAKGAAWLLVWSWQAAVLIACVWAGLKIFRVKSPALRHQVWLFAIDRRRRNADPGRRCSKPPSAATEP